VHIHDPDFHRVSASPVSSKVDGPRENAQQTITRSQLRIGIFSGLFLTPALILGAMWPLLAATAIVTLIYVSVFIWRIITTGVSLGDSTTEFSDWDIEAARHSPDLPTITILVPICREDEQIIAQQAAAFDRLVYPRHRLQIIVLVDADDHQTYTYARQHLPAWVCLLSVPVAQPRTKPRVLNYGLSFATGQITGVLDGEDVPEPNQLLKVAAAFAKLPGEVMCVQGRLVFRHPETNLLTRWAQVAYHSTFSLYMPALARLGLPVPLGGTSNYIVTQVLRELGGWDQWNVTEDLDLGVRLARNGWHIRVIDTITEEEPNARLRKCLNQWSRWEKGKIQTWLVHMRHPVDLWKDLGWKGFTAFQLIVGIPILMLLANPIFMLMTITFYLSGWLADAQVLAMVGVTTSDRPLQESGMVANGLTGIAGVIQRVAEFNVSAIDALFPDPILYLGSICLIAGNAYFIWTAATGALYRKQYGLVPAAILLPLHGLLLSASAYKGLWQIMSNRAHFWELTPHTVSKKHGDRNNESLEQLFTPAGNAADD
jgi:glycosyltransferase XagB